MNPEIMSKIVDFVDNKVNIFRFLKRFNFCLDFENISHSKFSRGRVISHNEIYCGIHGYEKYKILTNHEILDSFPDDSVDLILNRIDNLI